MRTLSRGPYGYWYHATVAQKGSIGHWFAEVTDTAAANPISDIPFSSSYSRVDGITQL